MPQQHFEKMKLDSHVVVVLVCVSQNCASQCQDNSCILSTQNKELSSLQDRLCLKSENSNTAQMRREMIFACPYFVCVTVKRGKRENLREQTVKNTKSLKETKAKVNGSFKWANI